MPTQSAITITVAAKKAGCSREAIYKALESGRLTEVFQLVKGVAVDSKWRTFLANRRKVTASKNGK